MTVESHRRVGLAAAKDRLSELITAVVSGETVVITRRGRPVATVAPVEPPVRPVDLDWLQRMTDSMPYRERGAGDVAFLLRDAARY